MIASWLTAVPGSSDAFAGGIVSYANEVKAGLLGVPQDVLREHGAVSAETAAAMAAGARRQLGADVAVSVTGVAGPGGGTPDKPVGLVHLHLASPEGEDARRYEFSGGRAGVRSRAATSALHMVRAHLVALPAVPPP
jgi:nicotinamide-nucleotide amidase